MTIRTTCMSRRAVHDPKRGLTHVTQVDRVEEYEGLFIPNLIDEAAYTVRSYRLKDNVGILETRMNFQSPSVDEAIAAARKIYDHQLKETGYGEPISGEKRILDLPLWAPAFAGDIIEMDNSKEPGPTYECTPSHAVTRSEGFSNVREGWAVQASPPGRPCVLELSGDHGAVVCTDVSAGGHRRRQLVGFADWLLLAGDIKRRARLGGKTVLEGLMTEDGFRARDLLFFGGSDLRQRNFDERYFLLEELLEKTPELLLAAAWNKEAADRLLADAISSGHSRLSAVHPASSPVRHEFQMRHVANLEIMQFEEDYMHLGVFSRVTGALKRVAKLATPFLEDWDPLRVGDTVSVEYNRALPNFLETESTGAGLFLAGCRLVPTRTTLLVDEMAELSLDLPHF